MNRDEFIALLSRLVSDGEISEADAMDLLLQFDAGTLPDSWALPLPVAEAIRQGHDDKTTEAALLALLLLLSQNGQEMRLRPFSPLLSEQLTSAIQDAFQARVDALAGQLARREIQLLQWQGQMMTEIESHVAQQMYLGNGRAALSTAQLQRLDRIVREQSAFLQRFADHIAMRAGQGRPWREEYVASRARQYGGVGRAEFFRAIEGRDTDAAIVVDYISRDDKFVCGPCLQAEDEGPYLPGTGPYPGEVCLGRDRCRCVRRRRYNPAAYARLTGQNAA